MNWDDIRVFLQVGRSNSLTAASKQLKMDPSTLGRRVARLEESMGTRLFVKTPQGYDLTESGLRLTEYASEMELSSLSALEIVQGQTDKLSGTVRIGAPDGSANFLLPEVCAEISEENPDLEIQILAVPRVLNLSKREADMAITVSPPSAGRLLVQKVTDYHLHLAATRDYIAAHQDLQRIEQVKDHPIIGYIPDLIFDKELDYLDEIGLRPTVGLASNSVSVQINMINQGAGLGVVHDFAMPNFPDLAFLFKEELALKRSFYLVRHDGDRRVGRLNRFADRLAAGMRDVVKRKEAT
jgi:DNA-binding transcriptional LysR family regulator